jgi:hypothetical protein
MVSRPGDDAGAGDQTVSSLMRTRRGVARIATNATPAALQFHGADRWVIHTERCFLGPWPGSGLCRTGTDAGAVAIRASTPPRRPVTNAYWYYTEHAAMDHLPVPG